MFEPIYRHLMNGHALQAISRPIDMPKASLAVGEGEILFPFVHRIAPSPIMARRIDQPEPVRLEDFQDIGFGPQVNPDQFPRDYWYGPAIGEN